MIPKMIILILDLNKIVNEMLILEERKRRFTIFVVACSFLRTYYLHLMLTFLMISIATVYHQPQKEVQKKIKGEVEKTVQEMIILEGSKSGMVSISLYVCSSFVAHCFKSMILLIH